MTDASQTSCGPEIGTVIAEKYRIIRHIGAGAMGIVLEAEHTRTGKRVAIKCLHPGSAAHQAARQRFMLEARASARVRHPNVVDVYDVVEEPDNAFMVMELLDGESLGTLMARRRLEPRRFIGLLLGAMRGVSAAHKQRVIHRDIKPDNIFLARQGDRGGRTPIVLDFGLSKLLDAPERLALTRSGIVVGTPGYMSPEQVEGKPDIDARTDIYAFGVILYEGLAGRMPFEADSLRDLMLRIVMGGAPSLRELVVDLPPGLEDVVERAMATDRAQRTPTLDTLIGELEPYVSRASFRVSRPKQFAARAVQQTASPPSPRLMARVGALIRASFRASWLAVAWGIWIVIGLLQWLARDQRTGQSLLFGNTRVNDKLAEVFEEFSDALDDALSVALELVASAVIGTLNYAARAGVKASHVVIAVCVLGAVVGYLGYYNSKQAEAATREPHVVQPAVPVEPEPVAPPQAAPEAEEIASPLAYPAIPPSSPAATPPPEPQRARVNHRARVLRQSPPAPERTPEN